jgi:hypothetical protein
MAVASNMNNAYFQIHIYLLVLPGAHQVGFLRGWERREQCSSEELLVLAEHTADVQTCMKTCAGCYSCCWSDVVGMLLLMVVLMLLLVLHHLQQPTPPTTTQARTPTTNTNTHKHSCKHVQGVVLCVAVVVVGVLLLVCCFCL